MGRGRGSRRRGQVPSLQRSALHQGLSPGPRLDFPPPSPSNERQSSTLMLRFYSCVPALSGDAPHWGRHSGGITHHTGGVPQGASQRGHHTSHRGCPTGGVTLGVSHWGRHTGDVTLGVSHWGCHTGGVTLGASSWGCITLGGYTRGITLGGYTRGITLGVLHRGITPGVSHWGRHTRGVTPEASCRSRHTGTPPYDGHCARRFTLEASHPSLSPGSLGHSGWRPGQ